MEQLNLDGIRRVNALNVRTRTMFVNDNLAVLRGINTGCIDLVYLDPPFNSNRDYRYPVSVPEMAGQSAFGDMWPLTDAANLEIEAIRQEDKNAGDFFQILKQSGGPAAYILFLYPRLKEVERILKPSGTLYLHCDQTAGHYVKMMLDIIFGGDKFSNEIVWCYSSGGASKKRFSKKHDVIFRYCDEDQAVFNTLRVDYSSMMSRDKKHKHKFHPDGKIMLDWWVDIPFVNPMAKERTGYPTQKPVALLERIIKASSNEGDVVLDPFAGCATTAIAAERLGRQWVGIDFSEAAAILVNERLKKDLGLWHSLAVIRKTLPERTDLINLPSLSQSKQRLYLQDDRCQGCLHRKLITDLVVDHILPKARGGTDHPDNLQLLCHNCNSRKGTKPDKVFKAEMLEERQANEAVLY